MDKCAHGGMAESCPKCMAKGGEAMEPGADTAGDNEAMDTELEDMCAEELMHAIEAKDKKGVLEAIRALVLSCKE